MGRLKEILKKINAIDKYMKSKIRLRKLYLTKMILKSLFNLYNN